MEQQNSSKVSRSAARHLRRKKLVAARKEIDRIDSSHIEDSSHYKIIPDKKKAPLSTTSVNAACINDQPVKVDLDNGNKCNIGENVDILVNHRNTDASRFGDKNDALMSKKKRDTKVDKACEQNIIKPVVADLNTHSKTGIVNSNLQNNMNTQEKSRSDVDAERKAKKDAKAAAKAAAKAKAKEKKAEDEYVSMDQVDDVQKPNPNIKSIERSFNNMSILDTKTESKSTETVDKKVPEGKMSLPKDIKINENASKTEEESKAELKRERRAVQEAQRAAKQQAAVGKSKVIKSVSAKTSQIKSVDPAGLIEATKKMIAKPETKDSAHEVKLFKHLYINRKNISEMVNCNNVKIHPSILKLGVQYAEKVIVGSNARCVALLAAIKQLINDFERPSQADFTRGLEASLQESVNYLNLCRPSAVSMQNALKHLKWQMSTLETTISDEEAKSRLALAIDTYIKEQILLADTAISDAIQRKISNRDVILTYGFSSLINKILCDAHEKGKEFRVIIIDSRPWLEGKELLRRLVKHGIDCSYMLINALSYIMPQVSKVFLGAHAILANGAVMSRVGTAQVALMAKAFNVPVLVACETHKSCERVLTDSIVYNEIGDPDLLLVKNGTKKSSLSNWRTKKTLDLLNITYDVTPADLVTAVVTELAILPCTSVPVILRIKPSEI